MEFGSVVVRRHQMQQETQHRTNDQYQVIHKEFIVNRQCTNLKINLNDFDYNNNIKLEKIKPTCCN